jgi:hypothetical protein
MLAFEGENMARSAVSEEARVVAFFNDADLPVASTVSSIVKAMMETRLRAVEPPGSAPRKRRARKAKGMDNGVDVGAISRDAASAPLFDEARPS